MPTREELLAKLMGTMQAPIAKFVRTLNEVPSKFVRTLAAVRDQKEKAAPPNSRPIINLIEDTRYMAIAKQESSKRSPA